jgi:hypothetical protein
MGLPKGRTNNKAGRPIGSTNKDVKELREFISEFISGNLSTIQQDFDKLESPKDRLMFIERLFQYTLPKLQAQSIEVGTPIEKMNLPDWMKPINELSNGTT